jgi:hypothetical protein
MYHRAHGLGGAVEVLDLERARLEAGLADHDTALR